jgi:acylphosphatase
VKTVRLKIAGLVQGVGYRAWAVQAARKLGLRGWVRNCTDGSVEMLLTGPPLAVAAMTEACCEGPPAAEVGHIRAVDEEDDGSLGFTARPTE